MNDVAPAAIWRPLIQQRVFRLLMRACAYPGAIADLAGLLDRSAPGWSALTVILATLLDGAVTLADVDGLVQAADWPLLQARRADPDSADFVACDGHRPPRFTPRLGSLDNPERGATLILRVGCLAAPDGLGERLWLQGPGIPGTATLAVAGLAPDWLAARQDWCAAFPVGVDCILVDRVRAVCLPRTTAIHSRRQGAC